MDLHIPAQYTCTYLLQEKTLNLTGTILYLVSSEFMSDGECFFTSYFVSSSYITNVFSVPLHFSLAVMDIIGESPPQLAYPMCIYTGKYVYLI